MLKGKRIVITRTPEQGEGLAGRLVEVGAVPLYFPVIQLLPLRSEALTAALSSLIQYNWLIFTSANAVRFFFSQVPNRVSNRQLPPVAAVGPATAAALHRYQVQAAFVPAVFSGEQLALSLGDLRGQRILLPRARIGRPDIVNRLRAQEAVVDDIALYDTVTAVPTPSALASLAAGFDGLTFTSPSTVLNFLTIWDNHDLPYAWLEAAVIACIGPATAEEATTLGLPVHVTASEHTVDGLVQALADYFQERTLAEIG